MRFNLDQSRALADALSRLNKMTTDLGVAFDGKISLPSDDVDEPPIVVVTCDDEEGHVVLWSSAEAVTGG